jgi:hypothetical protein
MPRSLLDDWLGEDTRVVTVAGALPDEVPEEVVVLLRLEVPVALLLRLAPPPRPQMPP